MWGPEYGAETHYLRVHVAHIRAKLEPDPSRPQYLITEPGVGYRLGRVAAASLVNAFSTAGGRILSASLDGVAPTVDGGNDGPD